jgi:DNA-directed RNA polymerase subunit omega
MIKTWPQAFGQVKQLDAGGGIVTFCPLRTFKGANTLKEDYLQSAVNTIQDNNVLINIISRRVKQLKHSHRPLVESLEKLLPEDIALREVIEGKIHYELGAEE